MPAPPLSAPCAAPCTFTVATPCQALPAQCALAVRRGIPPLLSASYPFGRGCDHVRARGRLLSNTATGSGSSAECTGVRAAKSPGCTSLPSRRGTSPHHPTCQVFSLAGCSLARRSGATWSRPLARAGHSSRSIRRSPRVPMHFNTVPSPCVEDQVLLF